MDDVSEQYKLLLTKLDPEFTNFLKIVPKLFVTVLVLIITCQTTKRVDACFNFGQRQRQRQLADWPIFV